MFDFYGLTLVNIFDLIYCSAGLGEDFEDVEDDENIEELDQQEVIFIRKYNINFCSKFNLLFH